MASGYVYGVVVDEDGEDVVPTETLPKNRNRGSAARLSNFS